MSIVTKTCIYCKVEKPIDKFSASPSNKDRKRNSCKACAKEYMRKYYDKNKKKIIGQATAYYQNNKEVRKAQIKEWVKRNPRKYKTYQLKKFGITVEDYEKLLEQQNGVCAICGEKQINGQMLAVDHCHDTGAIRGLLCTYCNTAIGYARDNIDFLRSMITYLESIPGVTFK